MDAAGVEEQTGAAEHRRLAENLRGHRQHVGVGGCFQHIDSPFGVLCKIRGVVEMAHHGGVGLLARPASLRVALAPLRVDVIADLAQALSARRRNQLWHNDIAEFEPLLMKGMRIRSSHAEGL